ncbi:MAG: hypothetical protein N4A54_01365 [Peptostreptococcaceae bacterium]|nr:hypothetical protein [Peptostreptococcaceae bacterium]
MLIKIHCKIFKFMKYRKFMRPMILFAQLTLLITIVGTIDLIKTEGFISYLSNCFSLIFISHGGFKIYEYFTLLILKITGRRHDDPKNYTPLLKFVNKLAEKWEKD